MAVRRRRRNPDAVTSEDSERHFPVWAATAPFRLLQSPSGWPSGTHGISILSLAGREVLSAWRNIARAVLVARLIMAGPVQAGVTVEEARLLNTTLTPMGSERAGNAEGAIPPWTGGYTTPAPGYRPGMRRADPFADEKPLFSITRANLAAYAEKLPEGAKALFAKFPDYRMDIYPTHRTAAAPQSVYDNILRNATQAHAASAGIAYGVEGAAGGIPFPIPKNGFEIVWNHLLAYWGPAREGHLSTYVVSANGTMELATAYREIADFPYYYPNATP